MSLIEVLATVLVITLGVLATMGSFTAFSSAARTSRVRAVAISVAQEQIEQLRPTAFAQLGLTGAPPAAAASEAPLSGPAASETLVTGGTVRPGADTFSVQGVTGRIYRYVTWRSQLCPAVTAKVQTDLGGMLATTAASISAALPDLCPASAKTKRITVAVVPMVNGRPAKATVLSTVAADPAAATPVLATAGLKVQPVVQAVSGAGTTPVPTTSQQAFNLTDTRCDATTRAATTDHATHNSALTGAACAGGVSGRPDLMTLAGIPGSATDPVRDFATDVSRNAAGGAVLMRDDRAGSCTGSVDYTSDEAATRRYSLHAWATPPAAAPFQTASSAGRAVLSLWTQTADRAVHPGRLCVVLRRMSTGAVLGASDFSLARWPTEPTELSTTFDLGAAALPAGERLELTLRVPKDSGADVQLLYDHAAHQSRLTVTTDTGKEFR